MNKNILFVDDEQNVLDGIRRQLRRSFDVHTALGAEEGLEAARGDTEFAVIVSDMRMPGMDGGAFLKELQSICPDTVRMMLTGNSDQETAIQAVNEGHIFRFLTKPCSAETLTANLEAGIRQYELITAEKELLEKTLKGSIKVLVDILALSNPMVFSRAERMKYYVSRCATLMKLSDIWQFEVAAMLSQIGYITVPSEIMEKFFSGDDLEDAEAEMISGHASVACHLLENIPRLENVARMIDLKESVASEPSTDLTITGAQIMRVAKEFDLLISAGNSVYDTMQELHRHADRYNPAVLEAVSHVSPPTIKQVVRLVPVHDLRIDMTLAEDVCSGSTLIVTKGQVVNDIMRRRLRNFVQQGTIDPEVRVYVEEQVFEWKTAQ